MTEQFAIDILIGIVLALLSWGYRQHKAQYAADQKTLERQRKEDLELLAERRTGDKAHYDSEIHQLDLRVNSKFGIGGDEFKKLWEEIERRRESQEKKDREFWDEIKEFRKKAQDLELKMAKEYVSNETLSRILDDRMATLGTKLDTVIVHLNSKSD